MPRIFFRPVMVNRQKRFVTVETDRMHVVPVITGKPQDLGKQKISQKRIKKALTSSNSGAILHVTRKKTGRIKTFGKALMSEKR